MISPILNINGTSADDLIQPRFAAYNAIDDLIDILKQATPNGRDYPGDNDKCAADREAHYARLTALQKIASDLISEAIAIKEQVK